MKALILVLVAFSTLLWGCARANGPGSGQMATVTLNDGSTFTGKVTSSSTSSISLQGTTGEERTIPMSQVSGIQYGPPTTPAQVATTPANPAPASAPVENNAPPPAPAQAPAPAPVAPAPPVAVIRTIPAGATIEVRNNQTINSETAEVGQTFSGVVEREVVDTNGRVAIPRGANATLVVRSASGQGKLQGRSDVAVDVSSVEVGGHHYRLETSGFAEQGKEGVGTNKRTGVFAGGGAALGGIIGAIAGGGKGAAIGALSGAGAGTVAQGVTRGKAVEIPAETLLRFKLEAPVRIHEVS